MAINTNDLDGCCNPMVGRSQDLKEIIDSTPPAMSHENLQRKRSAFGWIHLNALARCLVFGGSWWEGSHGGNGWDTRKTAMPKCTWTRRAAAAADDDSGGIPGEFSGGAKSKALLGPPASGNIQPTNLRGSNFEITSDLARDLRVSKPSSTWKVTPQSKSQNQKIK